MIFSSFVDSLKVSDICNFGISIFERKCKGILWSDDGRPKAIPESNLSILVNNTLKSFRKVVITIIILINCVPVVWTTRRHKQG